MTAGNLSVDSKSDIIILILKDNPIKGVTRLEKLVFLLLEEGGFKKKLKDGGFVFKPYRMGPFSSDIYDQVDFLMDIGILRVRTTKEEIKEDDMEREDLENHMKITGDEEIDTKSNLTYCLTAKGREIATKLEKSLSENEKNQLGMVKSLSRTSLFSLLNYVYSRYQEFTTKSEIKGSLGLK